MYAIVEIKGQQIKVEEGKTIEVPLTEDEPKQSINFEKVLFYTDEKVTEIGQPYLNNVTISANVIQHKRGPKLDIVRYKAKSNLHVQRGYRSEITCLKIENIRHS